MCTCSTGVWQHPLTVDLNQIGTAWASAGHLDRRATSTGGPPPQEGYSGWNAATAWAHSRCQWDGPAWDGAATATSRSRGELRSQQRFRAARAPHVERDSAARAEAQRRETLVVDCERAVRVDAVKLVVADVRPRAADHVMHRVAVVVDVLQVMLMAAEVRQHAVVRQQRLQPLLHGRAVRRHKSIDGLAVLAVGLHRVVSNDDLNSRVVAQQALQLCRLGLDVLLRRAANHRHRATIRTPCERRGVDESDLKPQVREVLLPRALLQPPVGRHGAAVLRCNRRHLPHWAVAAAGRAARERLAVKTAAAHAHVEAVAVVVVAEHGVPGEVLD
mmetsp:Transcript_1006/g.2719  ORF Transcript_1006/g.2719 Transcript_1006/m.2719 type:complete len:331 (-) Transcript_1006:839-1831(-)